MRPTVESAVLVLALGSAILCNAQTSPDALTNETIVKMVSAGVPATTIIRTIQAADRVDFRFLPYDLQMFQYARVPEEVVKAMAARDKPLPVPASVPAPAPPQQSPPKPAHAQIRTGNSNLFVKGLAYRAIPHESTTYYQTPGQSNTTCYGSGTYYGYSATATVNCSTVTTPPQNHAVTIRSVEVYNQVEAAGMVYTVRCTAHWVGSNCSWLIPGDTFLAEIKGTSMWILARKGGNLGKEMHAKFQLLDMRPKPPVDLAVRTQ